MTTAGNFRIEEGDIPDDGPDDIQPDNPPDSPDSLDNPSNWYDPQYPHSTQEAPYGFFPMSSTDPTPDYSRPRKRRPHKRGGGGSVAAAGMPASDKQARTAAALLARMNLFVGMGLGALGLPQTGQELAKANREFEEMAYSALLTDPALCRKILAAGSTSGKTQLTLAYVMLGGSLAPLAYAEIRDKRATQVVDEEGRNVA